MMLTTFTTSTRTLDTSTSSQQNEEWYPEDFSQLMLLKDNMDSHAYEIEENLKQELMGKVISTNRGTPGVLTDITGFDVDLEEYIPAYSDENALNAKISFHVDGECESNGIKSDVRKLPVWFDFQYIVNNTGYSIREMTVGC